MSLYVLVTHVSRDLFFSKMSLCGLAFLWDFFGSSSWSASSIWSINHFSQGPESAEHRINWGNTVKAIEYFQKICFLNGYFSNNRIQLLPFLGSLFIPCPSLSLTVSYVCHHNKIDSVNKWFKNSDLRKPHPVGDRVPCPHLSSWKFPDSASPLF